MTKMTWARLSLAATFAWLAFASSPASAQSCTADTDCPQSFACVVTGMSTPPACKGTDCPADAAASEPIVYKGCQPKSCASDVDCGSGMVCYGDKLTSCSGSGGTTSGCPANTKCDAGAVVTSVETCTTTTRYVCAFKWQVPCNADSDCGDGFVCQPNVSGGCATSSRGVSAGPNGTGGAATGGNSSYPPAADGGAPDCPTMASYPGACRPKATSCVSGDECPSGWSCTAVGTPVPISGAGSPASIGGDGSAAAPADKVDAGGSPTKVCVGPFGVDAPTRGGVDVSTGGQSTSSNHEGADAAIPPGSATGGTTGGTTGGATGGTTGGPKASSGSAGGCAIAPARAGDSAFLLGGLAVVALALVRRRLRR
jgi:Cys-rich repeat protein